LYDLGNELNHELATNVHVIGQVASVSSTNKIFYLQMLLLLFNYLPMLRKRRGVMRKPEANVHHDRASVVRFVHGWDDDVFRLSREGYYELEKAILDHKFRQGYELARHYRYASRSSGSPITLEL